MTVNKAKRLQAMITIRQMMIDGFSNNDILVQLAGQISERTFWRYVSRIFAQDIKNLQKMSNEQMMRAVSVHLERCNNIYRGLQALASDTSVDPESRRLAYNDMYKLSQAVIGEITNAPAAALQVQRKLKAIARGGYDSLYDNTSSYNHLPPAITREQQQRYYQEQVHREQQREQEQQEQEEQV